MINLEWALKCSNEARQLSNKVGYSSGVFDLFHTGHRFYLRACSQMCDYLIIGVDVDCLVRSKKGVGRPIDDLTKRLASVSSFPGVACAFAKDSSADKFLRDLKPDFYFVPDNRILSVSRHETLKASGTSLVTIPYYGRESTTDILNRRYHNGPDDKSR